MPVYPVSIRRSKRARNILLHVHPHGGVELVLPRFVSHQEGEAFLRDRHEWIMRALDARAKQQLVQKPISLMDGAQLPCFGDMLELSVTYDATALRSSIRDDRGRIHVRISKVSLLRRIVSSWYQHEAKNYFTAQSKEYADVLGVKIASIKSRDMKTQWGSCNRAKAALAFNWRLALGPEAVARYVAAHEVAHLVHPNHSRKFWDTVESLMGEYAQHRSWLKTYGGGLRLVSSGLPGQAG